jgi:glycosyltransferase involved in cell wall biosynthesis
MWNTRRFASAGVAQIRSVEPDIVVADYAWPAAAAVPGLSHLGIPSVVSGRGSDLVIAGKHPGLRRILMRALQKSGGWCAVAQHLVDLMDRLSATQRSGRLVANGVDLEQFRIRDRLAARSSLGIDPNGSLVLVVGHLIPRKDPLLALRAFARAQPNLASGRISFVGAGPLEGDLRRMAADLDVGSSLLMPGEQPPSRLSDWYAAADCLVLSSRWEGRPNVVLEALASGRPVLATATDGARELLSGHPGMLTDGRDPQQLADGMVAMVNRPPEPSHLRASVSGMTWEASCERLEGLLEIVVEESAAR